MKKLAKGYTLDFGPLKKQSWDELMSGFQDANLYQTWSYDTVRPGRQEISHTILRRNNAVVAAAQARLYRLPITKSGIAYVRWGPMWRPMGAQEDLEVYRQAVRGLRNEFSLQRGLVLRLYPMAYRGKDEGIENVLRDEGYMFHDDGKTDRTLILDLTPTISELRANLYQKWRNCLNRAERNGLELIIGEEDELIAKFMEMYWQMLDRKGLDEPPSDVNHLRAVQSVLSSDFRLKVILCYQNRTICAGGIFSAIGATGVYLSGATSDAGLKTNGSYMVQWAFVKWLKENGFRFFDLNGINPETNPGTYHFKRGLAGKRGMNLEFLGKFQVADSHLSDWFVRGGEWISFGYQALARSGRSLRHALKKGRKEDSCCT